MSNNRKCMSCGAEMPQGAWVCPACHARAVDDTELFESIFRQPAAEETQPEQPIQPRRRASHEEEKTEEQNLRAQFWRIVVVLSVLAVMIVAAVVVFLVLQNSSKTELPVESSDAIHLINEDGSEVEPTAPPQAVEAEDESEGAAIPVPAAEDEELIEKDETIYVIESGANLRAEPDTTSQILMSLPNGTELHCTGVQGNWCRVEYEGTEGYISVAVITDSADAAAQAAIQEAAAAEAESIEVEDGHDAVQITAKANVRSGPGTKYSVVAVVDAGTVLERVSVSGSWSCVLYNDQQVYVHNNMLRSTDGTADTAGSGTTGTIVSKANVRSGAGTKYSVVTVLDAGTTVQVTGRSGKWYSITTSSGVSGYVSASLMTVQ